MDEMGKAMMGTGEASGEDRAIQAAEKAIANPLLDEISLRGAKGVLINITGGHDLTLFELDEAANRIREEVDPDANIIVGSTVDDDLDGMMRVSVVATGIDANDTDNEMPVTRRSMAEPLATDIAKNESMVEKNNRDDQDSLFTERLTESDPESNFDSKVGKNTEFEAKIPDPIYKPGSTEAVAPMTTGFSDTDLLSFIPPKAPIAGAPLVETLNKLKAVVESHKEHDIKKNEKINNIKVNQGTLDDIVRDKPLASEQRSSENLQKTNSRFGINNLINRMTGVSSRVDPAFEVEKDDKNIKDNIEIPAFLRRQAN